MKPVIITRKYKHEAEQAIRDLEKRGFEVIFPLTEVKNYKKKFRTDEFTGRKIYEETNSYSCWKAKLKKVVD